MKKFSRKSVLLFGVVFAVCAFVVPSMASAASWSVVGTTHQLTSNNFAFTSAVPIDAGWSCATTQFDADVASASTIEITGARFDNCAGTGSATGCTVTKTGTRFPWTMTAPSTTDIQIHGIHVDVRFETRPPGLVTPCALHGIDITLTGTLTGGSWDPSSTGANRRLTLRNAPGLTATSILGSNPAVMTGDIRDPAGTLNLFM